MIRINLLPFRVARKKENIRQQISIFLLLVVLGLVALFAVSQMVNKKILALKQETEQVNLQITKFKEKAQRVKKIKADLKQLEEKLNIVTSLQEQREEKYILFDAMTQLIVPGRMWIESFKTNANSVTISGIAFDNPTIADYMEKLEKSPLFDSVDLKTAQMKAFQNTVMLKSFELLCQKAKPGEEKKTTGEKVKN